MVNALGAAVSEPPHTSPLPRRRGQGDVAVVVAVVGVVVAVVGAVVTVVGIVGAVVATVGVTGAVVAAVGNRGVVCAVVTGAEIVVVVAGGTVGVPLLLLSRESSRASRTPTMIASTPAAIRT
jgi:hypothetical protein